MFLQNHISSSSIENYIFYASIQLKTTTDDDSYPWRCRKIFKPIYFEIIQYEHK